MKILLTLALPVALSGIGRAAVLLDVINPPDQAGTPISLSFTVHAPITDIRMSGYDVYDFIGVNQISVVATDTGVPTNLLAQTWNWTAAPTGSLASQVNDGTAVNALSFGGGVAGSFDSFDQTIATTPGHTYLLAFDLWTTSIFPSELIVSYADSATPEPASVILLGLGISGMVLRVLVAHGAKNRRSAL